MYRVFVSGVGRLVWFLSPSSPDPYLALVCVPLFFSLSGWFRRRRVFSCLLFSLRRWGNPNLFGLGFPLCFFDPDAIAHFDPYSDLRIVHQGHCPAPAFFFFLSSSSLGFGSVFARLCSVGVGFPGGCFVLCLWSLGGVLGLGPGRFILRCMQDVTNAVLGRGRETRHPPTPTRPIIIMAMFWRTGVERLARTCLP